MKFLSKLISKLKRKKPVKHKHFPKSWRYDPNTMEKIFTNEDEF